MNRIFLLFVCLTISVVGFGQDKAASRDAAPEIPPGPSMEETKAWIKRALPRLGSYSIVKVKNDDRSKPLTYKYGVESVVLSDCRLLIHRTEEIGEYLRLTYTETVTLKDVDVSKIRSVEEYVGTGFTNSKPSYVVVLTAVADRGEPFTSQGKQEGFRADDIKATRTVPVRVGDKEAAIGAIDVLRRAAVLCGAPSRPVGPAIAESERKTEISQTKPGSTASPKMTNDEVIQLVIAGLSEQVISTSIRQATEKAFDLTPTGLIALKKAGVSDAVILVMQERGAPVPPASAGEAKTPPKYDATLSDSKKPSVAAVPQNGCSGIEMMGLYTEDMRPAAPLIISLAKIRNGTTLTRIVILEWLDMYGQPKRSQTEVKAGEIVSLQLARNMAGERLPINVRLSSCR